MGVGTPKIHEQFNWISIIDTLASGDITKYAQVMELSYEECLYHLLYRHHKDRYINEINRRQELKHRGG